MRTALFITALGAVITFAVHASIHWLPGLNLHEAGFALMVVGIGFALLIAFSEHDVISRFRGWRRNDEL